MRASKVLVVLLALLLVGGAVYTILSRGAAGLDSDGDGIPDSMDLYPHDRDNDGVPDRTDLFPAYDGALRIELADARLSDGLNLLGALTTFSVEVNGVSHDIASDVPLSSGQPTGPLGSILVDIPDDLRHGIMSFSAKAEGGLLMIDKQLKVTPDSKQLFSGYTASPSLSMELVSADPGDGAEVALTLRVSAAPLVGVTTLEWTFDGTDYGLDLEIDARSYYFYRAHIVPRHYTGPEVIDRFLKPVDAIVSDLAAELEAMMGEGWPEERRAGLVASMVQSMAYASDEEVQGRSEYWNYPVETLYLGKGDCEDSTILLMALYHSLGFDCAMLLYFPSSGDGHAAVGLVMEGMVGDGYEHEGVTYLYVETTNKFPIGEKPPDPVMSSDPVILPLPAQRPLPGLP